MLNFGHKGGAMRSLSGASLALAAVLAVVSVGCSSVGMLQAMKNYKAANAAYQQQDYKKAAELYELTLQAAPDEPRVQGAYFYLGNSYDQLWKPSKRGDAANDALLDKAVMNYQKGAEKIPSDTPDNVKLKKLALEYLVASYGPDKLNDAAKAEPVVQRMIQLDPGDPTNYFALAKIYEDSGEYELAESTLLKAQAAKPNDPAVHMQLAGYYNRQGDFPKTIQALGERIKVEPTNPEAHYTVATYYWDKAYRDFRLADKEKLQYVLDGIAAIDKAIEIKSDYMEAITYKNLLLRLQANLEKDRAKQLALLKEADELRDKANEMRKAKQAS